MISANCTMSPMLPNDHFLKQNNTCLAFVMDLGMAYASYVGKQTWAKFTIYLAYPRVVSEPVSRVRDRKRDDVGIEA